MERYGEYSAGLWPFQIPAAQTLQIGKIGMSSPKLRPGRPRIYDAKSTVHIYYKDSQSSRADSSVTTSRRTDGFEPSTDPFLVLEVRDIVCLLLNQPENVVLFCVDEKMQIQAMDQLVLCMGLHYVARVAYDYIHHVKPTLVTEQDQAL